MWQHVAVYNLRPCTNPLHKFHKVPYVADVPLDPDYVYRSAKYVSRSFELFDTIYKLNRETPLPAQWFEEEMDKLFSEDEGAQKQKSAATGSLEGSAVDR